jgi:hypothetical protein
MVFHPEVLAMSTPQRSPHRGATRNHRVKSATLSCLLPFATALLHTFSRYSVAMHCRSSARMKLTKS